MKTRNLVSVAQIGMCIQLKNTEVAEFFRPAPASCQAEWSGRRLMRPTTLSLFKKWSTLFDPIIQPKALFADFRKKFFKIRPLRAGAICQCVYIILCVLSCLITSGEFFAYFIHANAFFHASFAQSGRKGQPDSWHPKWLSAIGSATAVLTVTPRTGIKTVSHSSGVNGRPYMLSFSCPISLASKFWSWFFACQLNRQPCWTHKFMAFTWNKSSAFMTPEY